MGLHDQSPGAVFLEKIYDQIAASAVTNFDAQNISGDFSAMEIFALLRSDVAAATDNFWIRFNNDSGSNYNFCWVRDQGGSVVATEGTGTTRLEVGQGCGASETANYFSVLRLMVPFYSSTSSFKATEGSMGQAGSSSGNDRVMVTQGMWLSTSAITRVTLLPQSGTHWVAGSRCMIYLRP